MMYQTATCTNYDGNVPYNFANQTVSCDECGKHADEISLTSDFIYFCPNCRENHGNLPATMKQSLEKWLMGNVV